MMKKTSIKYDNEADAKYILLNKKVIAKTKKLKDWLLVDLDKKNNVIGIEILDASLHLGGLFITKEGGVQYSPVEYSITNKEDNNAVVYGESTNELNLSLTTL